MKTLVLIANSEWALVLQLEDQKIQVIEEREHPQSKEKVEHLVSDRPGRTFSRVSSVRHALNEGQDIHDTERGKFAREIGELCKQRYKIHPFQELWIVAGPKFLGELRPLFQSVSSPPYLIREIPKELSPHESHQGMMGKIQEWVHGKAPRKGSLWKSTEKKGVLL